MHAILATIAAFSKEPQGTLHSTDWTGTSELLNSVYSPLTAAAIFLVALAKASGPISDSTAYRIRDELRRLSGSLDVTELLVFSGWLTEHERCPKAIADTFHGLWRRTLTDAERSAFLDAAEQIAAATGNQNNTQVDALDHVRSRLA